MNERVKKLIAQCEYTTRHSYEGRGGGYDVTHFDKEKFAELVITECNQAVLSVPCYLSEGHDRAIEEACINDCAYAVLEHFGMNDERTN